MSSNMQAVYNEWRELVHNAERNKDGSVVYPVSVTLLGDEVSLTEDEVVEHLLEIGFAENKLCRPFHIKRYVKMFELGHYPYPKKGETDEGSDGVSKQ